MKEVHVVDGIRLASLVDIGLMKLDVQNRRNAWKDLIDLNAITDFHPLSELLSFYNKRYPAYPLKQTVVSLIKNLESPPSLTTFPSDLLFNNTNPTDVVSGLKVKWANLFKEISREQLKEVKSVQLKQDIVQNIPDSDSSKQKKPNKGIGQ